MCPAKPTFVFGGSGDGTYGRDGAAAANCRSGGNEECGAGSPHGAIAQQRSQAHREGDAQRGVEESAAAGVHHLLQVHPKAQSHNGGLQQDFGKPPGLVLIRVGGDCAEDETGQ